MATKKKRVVKKADEVAAVPDLLIFAKRMSTWTFDYKGLSFTLKALPSAVRTYITARSMTLVPQTVIDEKTGKETIKQMPSGDMTTIVYLTTKFATIAIAGLKSLTYDDDDNPVRGDDGELVTEAIKILPGHYQIAGRNFPCLQDVYIDQLPEEVLWAVYGEVEKVEMTEDEKTKADFTPASNETK